MTASQVTFYMLSAFLLAAAVLSVTTRKIFRSAVWLLFSLLGVAGLYFWMNIAFIAAVQIIVYVGGIVVLIIFSIFLTQKSGKEMASPVAIRSALAVLVVVGGFAGTCYLLYKNEFAAISSQPFNVEVDNIGMQLLSTTEHGYVLPFEVVSMLLLVAMIGCIVIAMKMPEKNEY